MFELNEHTDIEYVDDTWLHLHCSYGMQSIYMERHQYELFRTFLKGCLSQKPIGTGKDKQPAEREMKTGTLTFISEGPHEDSFNIFIDSENARTIIAIGFYQIEEMLEKLENG